VTWRVGIDIGGTFTDFAAQDDASGQVIIHKRLTTPEDPSRAVLAGLPILLSEAQISIGRVSSIVHGTTLVTNAIIERSGATAAMVCTAGFGDVLDIAKERRYDMYDLRIAYPEPLIPRALRIEVSEYVDPSGRVVDALNVDELTKAIAEKARQHEIESIAVCFLNSYASEVHEQAARDAIVTCWPDLYVSTSADVFPFIREYERWTTTTMNAFTQPMFHRYMERLENGLAGLGFREQLFIVTSNGCTVTPEVAKRYPVRLLESGPAAGTFFAAALGEQVSAPDLLAFDMGGTTAKGALIRNGAPLKRYEIEVGRMHDFRMGSGLPAKTPVIDLIEIGAGGGSLASVDGRGVIQVGPVSAGADPGPVCYDRGGTMPTVTDANLSLGYLDPAFFLGGEIALNAARSLAALKQNLAEPLDVDTLRAAWGVHETINEDVARAFRNHAAERGFDYRRSSMVAFGGSGPAHALRVARKLRVSQVIFPPAAGVASALGMLRSPLAFETLSAELVELEALDRASLEDRFERLFNQIIGEFEGTGLPLDTLRVRRALDMRYRGQGYEIEVAIPEGLAGQGLLDELPPLFAAAYEDVFLQTFPSKEIDIVAWKLAVSGPDPAGPTGLAAADGGGQALKGHRRAWFPEADAFVDTPVYDRYELNPGDRITGPALIEERECTCVIGIGDRAQVDASRNLVATPVISAIQGESEA
jgi:N-methylhydantoinase A